MDKYSKYIFSNMPSTPSTPSTPIDPVTTNINTYTSKAIGSNVTNTERLFRKIVVGFLITMLVVGIFGTIIVLGIMYGAKGTIIPLPNTPKPTNSPDSSVEPTNSPDSSVEPSIIPTLAPTAYKASDQFTKGCQEAVNLKLIPDIISWSDCESSGIGCTPTEEEKQSWCNTCATPAQDSNCIWTETSTSCPVGYVQIYANNSIDKCYYYPKGYYNDKKLCCNNEGAFNAYY